MCDIEKTLASISGVTIDCSQNIVKISDLSVMVVEDDKINQNVLEAMLKRMSVDTKLIDNGKEALKEYILHYDRYDMIFMDLRMPELNGIKATKFIVDFEKKNNIVHTPIIALTADITKQNKDDFIKAGADDFLSKPTKQTELLSAINKIIYKGI
jgi:CheY-like chemotaxis protein